MNRTRRAYMPIAALLVMGINGTQAATGDLFVFGNGEKLATQGYTAEQRTTDGWELDFGHIFVTVGSITAHQLAEPYDTYAAGEYQTLTSAPTLNQATLDLVDTDNSNRVLIGSVPATEGHYNALSWSMVPASTGQWAGYSLVIIGTANRDDERVEFTLVSADSINYRCGEYVGDERKGFLTSGGQAEHELTFHFDHIFGRSDRASDDPMNLSALGFDPFAAGGTQQLSLDGLHLGHVGEGHCAVVGL